MNQGDVFIYEEQNSNVIYILIKHYDVYDIVTIRCSKISHKRSNINVSNSFITKAISYE